MKDYVVLGIVAVILVITIVQFFQVASIKADMTGNVISASLAGETYEDMMARMHPEQAAQQAQQAGSTPAMVGGC